jgi:hypothetical protein
MKAIKKILLTLLCVFALGVASLLTLTVIYRNDLIKATLKMAAQNSELDFSVEKANLVLSLNLKNAKILFENVEVSSKNHTASKSKFGVFTKELYAEVDLLRFALRKELHIQKLRVSNGRCTLRLAQGGSKAPGGSASPVAQVRALLQEVGVVQLDNCLVSVEAAGGSAEVALSELSVEVQQAGKEGVGVRVRGALALSTASGKKAARRTQTKLAVDVSGRLTEHEVSIAGGKLAVDGLRLNVDGCMDVSTLAVSHLNISAKKLPVEKVAAQVQKYVALTLPEQLTGHADVNLELKGKLSGGTLSVKGSGAVHGAKIKLKETEAIHVNELKYSFNSSDIKNLKAYTCHAQEGEVEYLGFRLSGDATVANLEAPLCEVNAAFSGKVATLNVESLPEGSVEGSLHVRATGRSPGSIALLEGQAKVSKLKVLLSGKTYHVDGEVIVDKTALFPTLSIASEGIDGRFSGAVHGYLPALLGGEQAGRFKITGDVAASRVNVSKLLQSEEGSAGQPDGKLHVQVGLNVQAKEVVALDNRYQNVSCAVAYDEQVVALNSVKTDAFGGTLHGDAKLYIQNTESKRLSCDLHFVDIYLEKLSYLNKIFNIEAGTMQGQCSGAIALSATIIDEGLDLNTLKSTVNLNISKGRLLNFEPIQALSGYLKKSLLQDVRFSSLQNTISVQNGQITIPRTEIHSTALNTLITGTQEFKGDFDYHIMLYLNELLSGKEKNIETPIKDESATKLFLHFTRKNGKVAVTHDRQEWVKNMKESLSRKMQELKDLPRAAAPEEKQAAAGAAAPSAPVGVEWDEAPAPHDAKKPEKPQAKPKAKSKEKVEVEWEE